MGNDYSEALVKQPYKLDKRFYDTIYAEVGGGPVDEVAAVVAVYLNSIDKYGYEKTLNRSTAYRKKSKEYTKAAEEKLNAFEQRFYNRNQTIVNDVLTNPERPNYMYHENIKAFGEPKWASKMKGYKDIGRQRFYWE